LQEFFMHTSTSLAALALFTSTLLATPAGPAQAQTLRWASQGDAQTMDPHSQNESMTNAMNGQVYEGLVARDKKLGIVASLATEWVQVSPLVWRFKLRPNVKFHDGAPFTSADVVFSIKRGQEPTSNVAVYANAVGTPVAIDALTVEFRMDKFNPIFLQHLAAPLWMMNKAWAEKNKVSKPLDFKNKEESFAGFNQNGTGPFMLATRQPGIKTTIGGARSRAMCARSSTRRLPTTPRGWPLWCRAKSTLCSTPHHATWPVCATRRA
jgi:peptide/nickel transport system substrate-binding protein